MTDYKPGRYFSTRFSALFAASGTPTQIPLPPKAGDNQTGALIPGQTLLITRLQNRSSVEMTIRIDNTGDVLTVLPANSTWEGAAPGGLVVFANNGLSNPQFLTAEIGSGVATQASLEVAGILLD